MSRQRQYIKVNNNERRAIIKDVIDDWNRIDKLVNECINGKKYKVGSNYYILCKLHGELRGQLVFVDYPSGMFEIRDYEGNIHCRNLKYCVFTLLKKL